MKSTQIQQIPLTHLLVFDRGEEIVETLVAFARRTSIRMGHFQAIGAVEKATVAYWDWDSKLYEEIPVDEQVEVLSLLGNLTRDESGGPKVHAHVTLGKRDGSVVSGHLMSGVVRPTLELVLTLSDVDIRRRKDPETGLTLIDLE